MFGATGNYDDEEVAVYSTDGTVWQETRAPIIGDPSDRELRSLFGVSTVQDVVRMITIRCEITGIDRYMNLMEGDNTNRMYSSMP